MKTTLILLAATICVAACKKPESETVSQVTTTLTPAPVAQLADKDKDFINKAVEGGMLEVQLGHVVTKQAASPDVKTFGQEMIKDHNAADSDLKTLASTKGLILPTALDSSHQATLDKISGLGGAKLDNEYASDMVDDNDDFVKSFSDEAQNAKDPDVKAFAAKNLPLLQSRLQEAKDLKAKHAK